MRIFPRHYVAETVANVATNFHEGDGTAFHTQVLQRLHAALLAFGELLFGEKNIRGIGRGIWTRRIISL
jgi:hypothetical protein